MKGLILKEKIVIIPKFLNDEMKRQNKPCVQTGGISQEIVETVMANITMPYIFITQPYS